MSRDDAVPDYFLFVIDVMQKKVERGDALGEAAFEKFPFLGRNDAGHEVEGKKAFRATRIAIDVKGDALAKKGEVNRMAFGVEILPREGAEGRADLLVM